MFFKDVSDYFKVRNFSGLIWESTIKVYETEDAIQIYYTGDLITNHSKSDKFLNYRKDHAVEILKSDALKGWEDSSVEEFIENNLRKMDIILN